MFGFREPVCPLCRGCWRPVSHVLTRALRYKWQWLLLIWRGERRRFYFRPVRLPMTERCGLFLTPDGLLETAAHNRRAHFLCVNVCGTEGDSSPQHKLFFGGGRTMRNYARDWRNLSTTPLLFLVLSLWDSGVQCFHFTESIFMHDVIGAAAALPRLLNTELNHQPVL